MFQKKQTRLNRALFKAVRQEDAKAVQKLLDEGADPNAKKFLTDEFLIFHALGRVKDGSEIISLLVNSDQINLNVSTTDSRHMPMNPLGYSLFLKKHKSAKILLRKVDINQKVRDQTVLHDMAWRGRYHEIEFLLQNGADFTIRDSSGRTAKHIAKRWDNHPCVELLETWASGPRPVSSTRKREEVSLTRPLGNRVLEEIFNFETRERISLVRKTKDGPVEALLREGFDDIQNKTSLKTAFDLYARRGGQKDISVIHKRPAFIDKSGQKPS